MSVLKAFLDRFDLRAYKGSVVVAGGAARSLVVNDMVNDVDLFFVDRSTAPDVEAKLVALGGKIAFRCPLGHLTTLVVPVPNRYRPDAPDQLKVQLVTKQSYRSMQELVDSFDFTCTQFAWDGRTGVSGTHAVFDAQNKVLRLHRLTFPVSTIKRIAKYVNRGYTPAPGMYRAVVDATTVRSWSEDELVLYVD